MKPTTFRGGTFSLCTFVLVWGSFALSAGSAAGNPVCGVISDGSDGAFHPTQSVTLDLPAAGVFHFTSVTIPKGVRVTFRPNALNTPAYVLATEEITIGGTLDVSGGSLGDNRVAGPAGFHGGLGGPSGSGGDAGDGPCGGQGAPPRNPGGGGGFATPGGGGKTDGCVGAPGLGGCAQAYWAGLSQGGSGGGGGGGGPYDFLPGGEGGGGGGVLVLRTPETISITGAVLADGGNGDGCYTSALCGIRCGPAGGGAGGLIRLQAGTIDLEENGLIRAGRGSGGVRSSDGALTHFGGDGGYGYIFLESAACELGGSLVGVVVHGECLADFDHSGDVGGGDVVVFAEDFGRTDCSPEDSCRAGLDCDGDADGSDLARFLAALGSADCPY